MIKNIRKKYIALPLPVKAGIWFFVCNMLQKGVSIISTPIFTRLFTTAEYGRFNVFNSWLEILGIVFTIKLSAGVYVRGLVKYSDDRDNFTISLELLTTILSVFFLLIFLCNKKEFEYILGLSELSIFCIFISSWASTIFEFWAARNRVEYKYKALVVITACTTILKPVIGVISVLTFPNYRVEARIVSLTLVEFFCYIGLFIKILFVDKVIISIQYWRYALAFNIPLIPHYLSQTVLSQSDRLMIKHFVGDSAAGIYSLAHSLSWMMILINNAIRNVLDPWVYQNIKRNEINSISGVSYYLLILVAMVNFIVTAIAPEVVVIFGGPAYYDAIWVIPPLCISIYFIFLYGLFATFEFYFEKTFFMTIASVLGALLNLLLNYFFIDLFGYIAAGYTTMVCYIFYCVAHYFMMRRICVKYMCGEKIYNIALIIVISIVFMGACFLSMAFYKRGIFRYGAILALIILIYVKRDLFIERIRCCKK